MTELLGLVLLSFVVTSFFMVPFIDLLFYLKKRYKRAIPKGYDDSHTPITNKVLAGKDVETPVGGGILLIILVALLSVGYLYFSGAENTTDLYIILFTFLSFGLIGLLDDIKKILTAFNGKFVGLKGRYIFGLQLILAFLIAMILYNHIGINNLYISGFGNFIIGAWYIPLATFVIIAFSNAYNISDGLDGLSTGLLTICLFALLALASATLNLNLAAFIGLWLGSLFAFLYFNVYPARIYLGDAGSLSFGATLAVVGLLTGKILALGIIGGVFVVIVSSSAIQIFSKKVFKRKVFPVAPLHMYLRYIGWEEPKIVLRLWLAGAIFAIFGLWLALLSR
jgi:phospho-N-acetylmuramoyl-pentapeptide-transferase